MAEVLIKISPKFNKKRLQMRQALITDFYPQNILIANATIERCKHLRKASFEHAIINYTTTACYGENFRDINIVVLESPDIQQFSHTRHTRFESKWDKIEGIKVESTYRIDDLQNETNYDHGERRIQLTRTKAWPKNHHRS